jgi:hypothetical protein
MSEPMDNWKQFQGTELGGLMSQIYGNQRPVINYPKPKAKKNPLPAKDWVAAGNKADAVDPHKTTRRAVNIDVPKLGKATNDNSLKPVDLINKRRSADTIKVEMDDIKYRQSHFRPAYVQPMSSDSEKDRLNQIFTFKGGKGLPENLTHPVGEAPFEAAQRRKEQQRVDAIRDRRSGAPQRRISAPLSESEQMAQQITAEIDERRNYLEEMRDIGVKSDQETRIRSEIARKVEELNRLQI